MLNPATGRTWATMTMEAQTIGRLGNTRATTAYHPDGVSWRGVAHHGSITSLCNHAHRTELGARNCGAKAARKLRGPRP